MSTLSQPTSDDGAFPIHVPQSLLDALTEFLRQRVPDNLVRELTNCLNQLSQPRQRVPDDVFTELIAVLRRQFPADLAQNLSNFLKGMAVPRQQIPDQVFTELISLLKEKNKTPKKQWCEWLDRPIIPAVITFLAVVVGGLILNFLNTRWQAKESQKASHLQFERSQFDQRMALLHRFELSYQKAGNVVNSLVSRVLWLAQEKREPKPNQEKIDSWHKEFRALYDVYSNLEPVDSPLVEVSIVYSSDDVIRLASDMKRKWQDFEDHMGNTNSKWNKNNEKFTKDESEDADNKRRILKQDLEKLKVELIEKMTLELKNREMQLLRERQD